MVDAIKEYVAGGDEGADGEDGFTGEKMESHDISIKNDGISLEITHSLTINKEDWMNCVLSKSIKEDTNLFEEYYKTLKNFRKKLSNNNEARFPINFERKLELLVNKFSLSKEVKTDLDPKQFYYLMMNWSKSVKTTNIYQEMNY